MPRPSKKKTGRRLFVLDTNVLLHDPTCVFRFAEHDIFIPMMVLEELDHAKKGVSEVARNARQVSRTLDDLINNADRTAIEAIEFRSEKSLAKFTCAVGAEVETQDHITISYALGVGFAENHGRHEFIGFVLGCVNFRDSFGSEDIFFRSNAMHDGIPCEFNAIPSFIAIHGKITSNDCDDFRSEFGSFVFDF